MTWFRDIAVLLFLPVFGYCQSSREIIISLGDIPPAKLAAANRNKLSEVNVAPLIDRRYIDPNHDEIIDSAHLANSIKALYSGSKVKYGLLDWESKDFEHLINCDTSDARFQVAMSKYLKLLAIAKAVQPDVKWGFYALPYRSYWKLDSIERINNKLIPLLKECDVLLPSLYSYYPNGTPFSHNEKYFKTNITESLRIGDSLNKPVLAFVWHRWHDSNKKVGMQLIPPDEFRQYLRWILDASYNTKKVDGIVWFGVEVYYYPSRQESSNARFAESHRYYKVLREEMRRTPENTRK